MIFQKSLKDIKAGTSLSKSFTKYPNVFADIFIANLKVGEETGELAEKNGPFHNFDLEMQFKTITDGTWSQTNKYHDNFF